MRASPPSTAQPSVWKVFGPSAGSARDAASAGGWGGPPVSATSNGFATPKYADAVMRLAQFRSGSIRAIGAKDRRILRRRVLEGLLMRTLQPAGWSKPRGFSHGVELDGPGRWIVLAGQTGGDDKGEYQPDLAAQAGTALRRIVTLLAGGRARAHRAPDLVFD